MIFIPSDNRTLVQFSTTLYREQNMTQITITLDLLKAAATGTATRSGTVAFHAVSVEEARKFVKVKDGNRKPAKDGSKNLTVVLGKHTFPLDCISVGTTRLTVDQAKADAQGVSLEECITAYSEALLLQVSNGLFDEVIEKVQVLAREQAEKAAANPRKRSVKSPVEPMGLDLEGLVLDENPQLPELDTFDAPAEAE